MRKSETILNEPTFRNLCFIGAGNLSKGAKKAKAATLERFSKAFDQELRGDIKALVIGLSKGTRVSDRSLRRIVTNLKLIKPVQDVLDYQPTGDYERDLRVLRAFVQNNLPLKYLKIFANYHSGHYEANGVSHE